MKNLIRFSIISLFATFGLLSGAIAQNAQNDLTVTGSYRINTVMPLGKFRLWAVINNVSYTDYKDVVYQVQFFAKDGTAEGNKNFVLHDFVGQHTSKKLEEQYIDCPRDCKSISLSIVNGSKLVQR